MAKNQKMMRVIYNPNRDQLSQISNPVVTMGSYDGVHGGHRVILERVINKAREIDGESVVITFDPHPRKIIFPNEKLELLNTLPEKLSLLESVGIDNVVVIPFTKEFQHISSERFVKDFLFEMLGTKILVIGYNHHFGSNREGSFDYLKTLQGEYNFELWQIPKHDIDNEKVSSTIIRNLLLSGEVAHAAKSLCTPYFIFGNILKSGSFVPEGDDKLIPAKGDYQIRISSLGEKDGKKKSGFEDAILTIQSDKHLFVKLTDTSLPDESLQCKIEFIRRV